MISDWGNDWYNNYHDYWHFETWKQATCKNTSLVKECYLSWWSPQPPTQTTAGGTMLKIRPSRVVRSTPGLAIVVGLQPETWNWMTDLPSLAYISKPLLVQVCNTREFRHYRGHLHDRRSMNGDVRHSTSTDAKHKSRNFFFPVPVTTMSLGRNHCRFYSPRLMQFILHLT